MSLLSKIIINSKAFSYQAKWKQNTRETLENGQRTQTNQKEVGEKESICVHLLWPLPVCFSKHKVTTAKMGKEL